MRSILRALFAILAAVAVGSTLVAAPPPASTNLIQLRAWLAQLNDDDYARREEATERLHAAGDAAIDVLAEGALSDDPEAAWRAGEALKRIAITGNERTIDRVAEALEKVGKQGRQGVLKVIAEVRARQRQLRHDRVAAQIRRQGGALAGGLAGGMDGFAAMGIDVGFLPVPAPMFFEEVRLLEEVAPLELEVKKGIEEAAEKLAELPAAELLDEVKRLFKDELSLEHAPVEDKAVQREAVEPRAEPPAEGEPPPEREAAGGDIEDFRRLERLPVAADEPAEAPADEFAPLAAAEFAIDLEGFAFPAGVMVFGDDVGGVAEAEGMRAESLSLDANWRGGDKGLAALRDLPDVTSVSIQGAKLTDAALKHIAALPRLANLNIRGTKFSVTALRALHEARPKAFFFCQGDAMVGIHADTSGSCVLTSVYPASGAADAGLKEGDRIVAIDGVEIRDFAELTISVYGRGVGEKLKIEYERDGKRMKADVELKARKELER